MLLKLENHYKTCRMECSDSFRLRIHRSLSWLKQAEQTKELDFKFISLWIAFNAAYAREIEDIPIGDKATFNEFIMRICGDEDLRPRIQKAAYISSRYTRPLIIFDNKSIRIKYGNRLS